MNRLNFKPIYVLFFLLFSASAQAQGLGNVTSVLQNFETELKIIIPIVSTVIFILLCLAYMWSLIDKNQLVKWGIAVIFAGSASAIVGLLMGK